MNKLLWYLGLFLLSVLLGISGASTAVTLLVILVYILASLPFIMPILLSKNTDRMMAYLKKSRNSYYQFLYQFFRDDLSAAEAIAGKMRQGRLKEMAQVMLLLKEKRYNEAKPLLANMKDSTFKAYYQAIIAFEEGREEDYRELKQKVKEKDYKYWLGIEELVREENLEEALKKLDDHISRLRGIKLLSAVHYRKELMARIEKGER